MKSDFIQVLIATAFGFALKAAYDLLKDIYDSRKIKKQAFRILNSLIAEIDTGIRRCQYLRDMLENQRSISFSMIYTRVWDTMVIEVHKYIDEIEILELLHSIYNRFNLVNFNMKREAFDTGAAMARDHLQGLEEEFARLRAYTVEN